jgi:hypothetical protein
MRAAFAASVIFFLGSAVHAATFMLMPTTLISPSVPHADNQNAKVVLRQGHIRFDQQDSFKVVAPGARLHANAYFELDGVGQTGVFWQVARLDQPLIDPSILPFQSLGDMQLIQSPKSVLLSPALPTEQPGIYVVQVAASHGDLFYLHYQVSIDARQSVLAPPSIELVSPTPRQIVTRTDQAFLWGSSAPVAAYRYELYAAAQAAGFAKLSRPPSHSPILVAQLLGAQQTQLQLDPGLMERLPVSGKYFWRVVGLGLDGATVCRSQLQMVALHF